MATSYELKQKRKRYYSVLSEMGNVSSYLKNAYNDLADALEIDEYFAIDDTGADNNEIRKTSEKIKNTSDYLTNTIIPEIRTKINRLNREIDEAEESEEEDS